jgi:hypothetical protein
MRDKAGYGEIQGYGAAPMGVGHHSGRFPGGVTELDLCQYPKIGKDRISGKAIWP